MLPEDLAEAAFTQACLSCEALHAGFGGRRAVHPVEESVEGRVTHPPVSDHPSALYHMSIGESLDDRGDEGLGLLLIGSTDGAGVVVQTGSQGL